MNGTNNKMNPQEDKSLDLGTMMKRLSVLNSYNLPQTLDFYPCFNEDDGSQPDSINETVNMQNETINDAAHDEDYNEDESVFDTNITQNLDDRSFEPLNIIVEDSFEGQNSVEENDVLKTVYEDRIIELQDENAQLKEELNSLKDNLRQNDAKTNQDCYNLKLKIDALVDEKKILTEQLNESKNKAISLSTEMEKYKKYAELNKMQIWEINKKNYQLIGKIGQGGFSEVFHCVSYDINKSVAIKKVEVTDKENFNLMMNEINLLKRLQHTNKVVQLYDYEYIEAKRTLYLIMEFGSDDLNSLMKKEVERYKCVREPTRVYIWYKMLEAVVAIHRDGIIHSDLKPNNFLIVAHEIKLIDFNISNTINDRTSVTVTNDCGTLHYMPPESIQQNSSVKSRITLKSDVWSLGVILYLMTYGRLPFQHIKNPYQLMFAICDQHKQIDFPTIRDESLYDVLVSCLQHDPSKRYSTEELLNHKYISGKYI